MGGESSRDCYLREERKIQVNGKNDTPIAGFPAKDFQAQKGNGGSSTSPSRLRGMWGKYRNYAQKREKPQTPQRTACCPRGFTKDPKQNKQKKIYEAENREGSKSDRICRRKVDRAQTRKKKKNN